MNSSVAHWAVGIDVAIKSALEHPRGLESLHEVLIFESKSNTSASLMARRSQPHVDRGKGLLVWLFFRFRSLK